MTLHLHLVCGAYHVAVDAALVAGLCGDDDDTASQAVDLRQILAVSTEAAPAKVMMRGGHRGDFVLAVDRVVGTVDVADRDFSPLPPLFRRATPLFDAVLARADDDSPLLRLSSGFHPSVEVVSPP